VNEVVEGCRRENKRVTIIKVDFEKAYDSVRWQFLYYMTIRLRFCNKWVGCIRDCMESTSISMSVNGSPTHEFRPNRRLRQWDSMAPFLYLIVANDLAGLVREVTKKQLL